MRLPFSADQFFDVFGRYNQAIWPAQWSLLGIAVLAVALPLRAAHDDPTATGSASRHVVSALLALLWLWMGVVYHLGFFSAINPAAAAFGVLFIAQAAIIAREGVWRKRLYFRAGGEVRTLIGTALMGFSIVVYPALGALFGHRYPASPTFGLPCPTTIFTLGLLLWAEPPVPRVVVVIPLVWAVVGTFGAIQLGLPEDFGLSIAALIAAPFLLSRSRHVHDERPRVAATPVGRKQQG